MYFWVNGVVVPHVYDYKEYEPIPECLRGHLCFDPDPIRDFERVGVYEGPTHGGWKHRKIEALPNEFKLQLLLLGVAI